jgi:hypothetical protein
LPSFGDPTVSGGDTTPSIVTVNAPVPRPTLISREALVCDVAVKVTGVTSVLPFTLFCTVTTELLVHCVPVPDSRITIGATISGFAPKEMVGVGVGVGVGVTVPLTVTFCDVAPLLELVTVPANEPTEALALIRTSIVVDGTEPDVSERLRVEL